MEEKKYEELYTKGFNEGYLISRFEPELSKKIANAPDTDNPYLKGLFAGKTTHERELFLQNLEKSRAVSRDVHRPKMR